MLRYAGLLLGLLVAGVQASESQYLVTWTENGCSIENFPWRGTSASGDPNPYTRCCADDQGSSCYYTGDWCKVANENYQCCFSVIGEPEHTGHIGCASSTKESCLANSLEWCPPPPAPAAKLSSGAIGGIVVGAYLGVAGAFGAFAAYRGSHNYGTAAGV